MVRTGCKPLPEKGKKNLPVSEKLHERIDAERYATKKPMYRLVEEAWAVYEREKSGGTLPEWKPEPPKDKLCQAILRWKEENPANYKAVKGIIEVLLNPSRGPALEQPPPQHQRRKRRST